MLPSLPRLSGRASEWRSRPKPSANTSARWAIAGSAPATCQVNHRTPTRNAKPEKSWRVSKKGSKRRGRPEVPGRERLLFVPAPELHLDAKGHGPPASGEEPVGVPRTDQPHRHALFGRGGRAVGVLGDRGLVPQCRGQALPGRLGRAGAARGQALRGRLGQRAVSHCRGDSRARGTVGGEGAEVVPSAILLPAPEPDRGGVAQAQGFSDAKT